MRTENCCGIRHFFYPAGQSHDQRLTLSSTIRPPDHKPSGKTRFPPGQKRGESTSKSGFLEQSPASRLRSTQCLVCYVSFILYVSAFSLKLSSLRALALQSSSLSPSSLGQSMKLTTLLSLWIGT